MSLMCLREVIQLIYTMILLSLNSMFVIPKAGPHQSHYVANHDTYFISLMGDTSRPSCNRSLPIDISSLSRVDLNFFPLVPWGLHMSMEIFLTLGDIFSSLAFDRHILCGVWLQLIHSNHMDCTTVPWEPLTSLVVSLMSVNELNNWPVIRWCLSCSTSTPLFTWLDSYIGRLSEWDRRPQI